MQTNNSKYPLKNYLQRHSQQKECHHHPLPLMCPIMHHFFPWTLVYNLTQNIIIIWHSWVHQKQIVITTCSYSYSYSRCINSSSSSTKRKIASATASSTTTSAATMKTDCMILGVVGVDHATMRAVENLVVNSDNRAARVGGSQSNKATWRKGKSCLYWNTGNPIHKMAPTTQHSVQPRAVTLQVHSHTWMAVDSQTDDTYHSYQGLSNTH